MAIQMMSSKLLSISLVFLNVVHSGPTKRFASFELPASKKTQLAMMYGLFMGLQLSKV